MGSFGKNMLASSVSLLLVFLMGASIVWYLDDRFGQSVGGVVSLVIAGILLAFAIVSATVLLTNRTHQSAGEDVVEFSRNEAKTKTQVWSMMREDQRAQNRERAALDRQIDAHSRKLASMYAKGNRHELDSQYRSEIETLQRELDELREGKEQKEFGFFGDSDDDPIFIE